ncbi:hypothetical protein [Microbacterium mangrovi]|uniref:hypothetical protein n=1 Tax=Microbacterium mangrovi TaxID=1348253 RepID=UPI0012E07C0D|nr:hypothetical protein [Microbacterium mangrovi]
METADEDESVSVGVAGCDTGADTVAASGAGTSSAVVEVLFEGVDDVPAAAVLGFGVAVVTEPAGRVIVDAASACPVLSRRAAASVIVTADATARVMTATAAPPITIECRDSTWFSLPFSADATTRAVTQSSRTSRGDSSFSA